MTADMEARRPLANALVPAGGQGVKDRPAGGRAAARRSRVLDPLPRPEETLGKRSSARSVELVPAHPADSDSSAPLSGVRLADALRLVVVPDAPRLAATLRARTPDDAAVRAAAAASGVPEHLLRRARAGRPVNVEAHLRLAAFSSGAPAPRLAVPPIFLAHGLRALRSLRQLDMRAAAKRAGVGLATWSRAEREAVLSAESYLKLARFAGGGPWHYVLVEPRP
jgi:hypothetical protein